MSLPVGFTWTELASGMTMEGGWTVVVAAPLNVIPVFARDGALSELLGGTAK